MAVLTLTGLEEKSPERALCLTCVAQTLPRSIKAQRERERDRERERERERERKKSGKLRSTVAQLKIFVFKTFN